MRKHNKKSGNFVEDEFSKRLSDMAGKVSQHEKSIEDLQN